MLPDFIALRGDPSDKVPGAPGVAAHPGLQRRPHMHWSSNPRLRLAISLPRQNASRLFRSLATINEIRCPPLKPKTNRAQSSRTA